MLPYPSGLGNKNEYQQRLYRKRLNGCDLDAQLPLSYFLQHSGSFLLPNTFEVNVNF